MYSKRYILYRRLLNHNCNIKGIDKIFIEEEYISLYGVVKADSVLTPIDNGIFIVNDNISNRTNNIIFKDTYVHINDNQIYNLSLYLSFDAINSFKYRIHDKLVQEFKDQLDMDVRIILKSNNLIVLTNLPDKVDPYEFEFFNPICLLVRELINEYIKEHFKKTGNLLVDGYSMLIGKNNINKLELEFLSITDRLIYTANVVTYNPF